MFALKLIKNFNKQHELLKSKSFFFKLQREKRLTIGLPELYATKPLLKVSLHCYVTYIHQSESGQTVKTLIISLSTSWLVCVQEVK